MEEIFLKILGLFFTSTPQRAIVMYIAVIMGIVDIGI
jgi:hypothetical protein